MSEPTPEYGNMRFVAVKFERWRNGQIGAEVSGFPGDGAELTAKELRDLGSYLIFAAADLDLRNRVLDQGLFYER